MLLSDWLASAGLALNTRCAGRGLCRGCGVCVDGEPRKACQLRVEDVANAVIVLPRASRHDRGLHGVSAFEIADGRGNSPRALRAGVALDVGTTTLAAALWRGDPAQCEATLGAPNPQIRFGDNVVSRIHHGMATEGGDTQMTEVLWEEGILPLLSRLCPPGDVEEIVVTGNPAMLHTVAGEPLRGLAAYPFRPVFLGEREIDATRWGVRARVRLAPSLGPFVGADVSAGALACGMADREGPSLLMDFGTNGELLLKVGDVYLAAATALGPAFEGGRLSRGATAAPGVLGGVEGWSVSEGWRLRGMGPWHGIAGAAYVDVMAIGRREGLLTAGGRLEGPGHSLELVPGLEVTEADIAELLQAKAAVQAGWTTLLELAGLRAEELRQVWVAGGFGYHLTPAHAQAVGLIPPVPLDRVRLVGNSSLGGASLLLADPSSFEALHSLCSRSRHIELNQIGAFEDHYIDALLLEDD